MAIELGPMGIAVNVVTPAFTLTDASMIMPEAFRERVKETRPLKKHLYPEDVAGAIEQAVVTRAQTVRVAPLAGRAIEIATSEGRHRPMIDALSV